MLCSNRKDQKKSRAQLFDYGVATVMSKGHICCMVFVVLTPVYVLLVRLAVAHLKNWFWSILPLYLAHLALHDFVCLFVCFIFSLDRRSLILDPWSLILDPRSSILDPRSSILDPRSSILGPRSSILGPRSSILDPRSSILDPRSSILVFQETGPARKISI